MYSNQILVYHFKQHSGNLHWLIHVL